MNIHAAHMTGNGLCKSFYFFILCMDRFQPDQTDNRLKIILDPVMYLMDQRHAVSDLILHLMYTVLSRKIIAAPWQVPFSQIPLMTASMMKFGVRTSLRITPRCSVRSDQLQSVMCSSLHLRPIKGSSNPLS